MKEDETRPSHEEFAAQDARRYLRLYLDGCHPYFDVDELRVTRSLYACTYRAISLSECDRVGREGQLRMLKQSDHKEILQSTHQYYTSK